MGKIGWKQKLTSRKFWVALAGAAATVLAALHVDEMTIEQVVTILGAVGLLATYIFAEAKVDVSREAGGGALEGLEVVVTEESAGE